MSSFLEDLTVDLANSFFDPKAFGEVVTIKRGNNSYTLNALFDTPELSTDSIGIDVEGITHTLRLFVRSADLPDNKPRKNDTFVLTSTQFHAALKAVALDYVFEKDGVVVYRLRESK